MSARDRGGYGVDDEEDDDRRSTGSGIPGAPDDDGGSSDGGGLPGSVPGAPDDGGSSDPSTPEPPSDDDGIDPDDPADAPSASPPEPEPEPDPDPPSDDDGIDPDDPADAPSASPPEDGGSSDPSTGPGDDATPEGGTGTQPGRRQGEFPDRRIRQRASDEDVLATIEANAAEESDYSQKQLEVTGFEERGGELQPVVVADSAVDGTSSVPEQFRNQLVTSGGSQPDGFSADDAVLISDDGELAVALEQDYLNERQRENAAETFDEQFAGDDIGPSDVELDGDTATLTDEAAEEVNATVRGAAGGLMADPVDAGDRDKPSTQSSLDGLFNDPVELPQVQEQRQSQREEFRSEAADEFGVAEDDVNVTYDAGEQQFRAEPELTEDQSFLDALSGDTVGDVFKDPGESLRSAATTAAASAALPAGIVVSGASQAADELGIDLPSAPSVDTPTLDDATGFAANSPLTPAGVSFNDLRDGAGTIEADIPSVEDVTGFAANSPLTPAGVSFNDLRDGAATLSDDAPTVEQVTGFAANSPLTPGGVSFNDLRDGAATLSDDAPTVEQVTGFAANSPLTPAGVSFNDLRKGNEQVGATDSAVNFARTSPLTPSGVAFEDLQAGAANVQVPVGGRNAGEDINRAVRQAVEQGRQGLGLATTGAATAAAVGAAGRETSTRDIDVDSEDALALGAAGVVAPEPSTSVGGAIVAGGAALALLAGGAIDRQNEIETPEEPQSVTTELDIDETAPTTINSELEPGERDVVELPLDDGSSPGSANVEVEVPDDAEFASSDIVINEDGNLEMPAEATAVSAGLRYEDEEEEEDEEEDEEEEEAEVEEEESEIFVEIENIERGEEYLDEEELPGTNEGSDTAEPENNQELEDLLEEQLFLRPGARQGQGQESEEAGDDLAVNEEYIPFGSVVGEFTDSEWGDSEDLLNDEIFENQQQREVDSDTTDVLSDTLLEEQSDGLLSSPAGGDSLTGAFGTERDQQGELSDTAPNQDIFEGVFADDASTTDTMADVFADDAAAADTMADVFSDIQSDTQLDDLFSQNLSTGMPTPTVETPQMSPINMETPVEQYGQSSGGSLSGSSENDPFDSVTEFESEDDIFDTGVASPDDALDDLFGEEGRGSDASPPGFGFGGSGSSGAADDVFGGLL